MVLQNHNTIQARSITLTTGAQHTSGTTTSTTSPAVAAADNTPQTAIYRMNQQRPIIDLLVAMIAVPILILCALQLEKNLHDMANSPESRWLVFALGIGMLIVSVIICGYVTHRMGVCIWAGPIDETGNRVGSGDRGVTHINSQNDILRIVDSLPPSYDSVVKFDIPPPPYDCLVIDMEQCKEEEGSPNKPNATSADTSTINSQNDILRIVDSLPPSYDSVVKFDIPPPPYDCLVIDMEQCKEEEGSPNKPNATSADTSTVHM